MRCLYYIFPIAIKLIISMYSTMQSTGLSYIFDIKVSFVIEPFYIVVYKA